jgi:hypothetical protein
VEVRVVGVIQDEGVVHLIVEELWEPEVRVRREPRMSRDLR